MGGAGRVFRRLLVLYPPRYRRRFGDEAITTFVAAHAAARARGTFALLRFWRHNLTDVARSAIAEWKSEWKSEWIAHRARTRERRGPHGLAGTGGDAKVAIRALSRRPLLTGSIVVTLALGLGANSAVFALIDGVLLRPVRLPHADRLVSVYQALNEQTPYYGTSYLTYSDLRDGTTRLVGLAAFDVMDVGLRSGEVTDRVVAEMVTANYFEVLGVGARIGRRIEAEDVGADRAVVVLSDALWAKLYDRSVDALGRMIELNGRPFTVIGVVANGFRGTDLSSPAALWIPLELTAEGRDIRWFGSLGMVGRLAEGADARTAEAELDAIYNRILVDHPNEFRDGGDEPPSAISVLPISAGATAGSRDQIARFVALPFVVAALTLLIACLNVAMLQLVRASERVREFGVRMALGAGRWRVVRQLLVESILLAGLGCLAGVLAAHWFIELLSAFALPGDVEIGSVDITVGGRVLGVSAGLAFLTALGFGTAPAVRAANTAPGLALRATRGRPATNRVRNGLIAAQVALSLALLIGAALFVRSVRIGLRTELGFDATRVAALSFGLRPHGYDVGQRAAFYRNLLDRVSATAGIDAVALASHVPLAPRSVAMPVSTIDGNRSNGSAGPAIAINAILGDYFGVLGIPLLAGRVPARTDDPSVPKVAVVNEAAARVLWPDLPALGRQFQLIRGIGEPITVVGIVANAKAHSLLDEAVPFVYVSALQHPNFGVLDRVSAIARGEESVAQALTVLRREIKALDQTLPVFAERRVHDQLERVLMPQRFGLVLLGLFGSLTLLVSAVGVYGVVAYAVTQRRFEIGVRRALGARGLQITSNLVRDITSAVSAGVLLGLVGAFLTSRLLATFLFGVSALDARAFAGATLILCAVAALAAWLPARRAARMDPTTAIRADTN